MGTITRRPSSIHIFLADGHPDGLREVQKPGWTGHAIVCPRSSFPEEKARDEFTRPGVYVLFGPSEESDLPTVYIGEGDPTRPRLEQHYLKKDFWTSLIVFTSTDKSLTKGHIQYLESRLVSVASAAKRCVLDNGNVPQLPTLGVADRAAMEAFLEEMLLIYPLLGLTAFEMSSVKPPSDAKKKKGEPGATLYQLTRKEKGITARGYDKAEGFVVLAGSKANKENLPAATSSLRSRRDTLVKQGLLVPDGEFLKFTQDYTFTSSSQAASVVLGGNASGPAEWKDDLGRTLKENEQAAIGG
jgi:Domain of unknown function (DUF4357)